MKQFRPSLWSTLALVAVGSGLLSLGFWQVDRYAQMSTQKERFDQRMALAPQQATRMPEVMALPAWRRATLQGRFSGQQARIINKYIDGQLGVWLAAPLTLSDGISVLVLRGWVPDDGKPWSPPEGPQSITGMLQDGSGDLDAHIKGDEFRSLSSHAVWAHYGQRGVHKVFLQGELVPSGHAFPEALPRRGFYPFRIRRPHREYAGTWFSLALALFGLWLYSGRRRARMKGHE